MNILKKKKRWEVYIVLISKKKKRREMGIALYYAYNRSNYSNRNKDLC